MPVAQVAERQHLRSASRNLLVAPRFKLNVHVWPSCLCRGCASNLELTVGRTAKPGPPQCHLPTQLKDVSVSTIPGSLSALEALCDYALYKSTFTFTLLLGGAERYRATVGMFYSVYVKKVKCAILLLGIGGCSSPFLRP